MKSLIFQISNSKIWRISALKVGLKLNQKVVRIFLSTYDKPSLNIKKKLDSGFPSVPSTIKDELNCNIFLRAKNQEEFSKLRDLKDNF